MSKITVIRSTKTKAPKGYDVIELAYKTEDGKTKGMKLFPFGDGKEIAAVAEAAKVGDVLEASFKQNEKGFWNFGSLKQTGEVAATSGVSESKASPAKGNWETTEERAARQVLIVRQSSLSSAIAYFEASKQKPTVEDVVAVAQQLESYVMSGKQSIQQTGDVQ